MSAAKPAEKPHTKDDQAPVRIQLIALLRGGQAHATFDEAVKDLPANLRSVAPENLPYSAWQLLEHLRITQLDILNFSAPPTGGYQHIKWPDDYWPKSPEPPSDRTPGTNPSPPSAPTSNASKPSSKTLPRISISLSAGATARTFSAKRCSSPITTPTILANSSSFAASSEHGLNR